MEEENNVEDNTRDLIISTYRDIVKEKKSLPVFNDFLSYDVSRVKIRYHFGTIDALHEYMMENHRDYINEFFSDVNSVFSPERSVSSGHKRYVITTAVADSKAHVGFLETLKFYCQKNKAQLVIMPCESVTNSFENKKAVFDPVFSDPDIMVVTEDTPVNDNFSLCSIQVSAKQIKSITGLSRLGNREGSYVFASPKQFLEYIPSGNNRGKNYAIMTPGACTLPSYYTETFVSKRLSYIAHADHTIGAIIVDVENDKRFDFRQIQADENGSFIDMGIQYNPDSTTDSVLSNIILGDIHATYVDQNAVDYFIDKFKNLQINNLFLHDIFDAYSISHHVKDIGERSLRVSTGLNSLEDEVALTFDTVKYIDSNLKPNHVRIVKSNHDEFLDRYLAEGRYVDDPQNHQFSLKIAPSLFEEKDILETAFQSIYQIPSNWIFHSREDSFKIADVECAAHGDLGMNGAKCSLNSLEKIYGSCVTGHTHSAAIQRNVFRVGTLSKLFMRYNRGPSSWTQTCCILYENGQRQLINYIGE